MASDVKQKEYALGQEHAIPVQVWRARVFSAVKQKVGSLRHAAPVCTADHEIVADTAGQDGVRQQAAMEQIVVQEGNDDGAEAPSQAQSKRLVQRLMQWHVSPLPRRPMPTPQRVRQRSPREFCNSCDESVGGRGCGSG